MARLWSIRKSSEKLASFSGEAGEASFSELFGVIEQSFLELFGAFPVIERTLSGSFKGTRKVFSIGVQMKERKILSRKVVWTISSKFLVFEKRASEEFRNSCRKSTCGV